MSKKKQGAVLQAVAGTDTQPLEAIGTLDPRNAAAETLAAFLRCAVFARGGGNVGSKEFLLESVAMVWPDPKREVEYPSASIIDAQGMPYEAHSFVPTALEETRDEFCPDTVLWKTGEVSAVFQVDFWATDDPTREAIAARLPSLFSPTEGRAGVLLEGDPRYFSRSVRATLLESERMDTAEAVYDRERRFRTLVRCDVDDVHLRRAVQLQPRQALSPEDPE